MILLQKLLTVFAKVFGIHSTSAAVSSSQPAASLTVETSSVAVVGGGRRPARLRGKAVRLNCSWQVVEHDGSALVLRRSDEVPADVDGVLTTTAERIKKFGAGRRPENLEGLTVRVITTWTVHEDRGDRLLLCLIPS